MTEQEPKRKRLVRGPFASPSKITPYPVSSTPVYKAPIRVAPTSEKVEPAAQSTAEPPAKLVKTPPPPVQRTRIRVVEQNPGYQRARQICTALHTRSTLPELQQIATDLNLSTEGTKQQLCAAIAEQYRRFEEEALFHPEEVQADIDVQHLLARDDHLFAEVTQLNENIQQIYQSLQSIDERLQTAQQNAGHAVVGVDTLQELILDVNARVTKLESGLRSYFATFVQ